MAFYNLNEVSHIRELKTARIGQLLAINGTVTRTSQVRPELILATFRCRDCRNINKNIRQQFKYTEPQMCTNPVCENRDKWELDTTHSQFVDWQQVRVQENSQEIPAGSMPRTINVVLRNEIVEKAKPGDKVVFTGVQGSFIQVQSGVFNCAILHRSP